MAAFAVEDALLKTAARTLPVGQVLVIFGCAGMVAFAMLARARGQRLFPPQAASPVVAFRAVAEVTGRLFFTLAFVLTPLTQASAILQAAPLVVVAGAALWFGERVSPRRWAAVVVGFLGVLVILRPGLDGFQTASLLAVAGMLGFALRDLATRAMPPELGNFALGVYGFAAMVPAGAGLMAVTGTRPVPVDTAAGLALAAATAVGVLAYWSLTAAMRTGQIGAVAPFRYTRLVFAMLVGVIAFGERPDAATLIGSAIVVAAGIAALARDPAPRG
jgi:drug/metabolite transporter (DMT)-like permease